MANRKIQFDIRVAFFVAYALNMSIYEKLEILCMISNILTWLVDL